METYKLQIEKDIIRFDNINKDCKDSFIVSVTVNDGFLEHAELRWRDNKFYMSSGQRAIVNNRNRYTVDGPTILDIFKSYIRENRLNKSAKHYFCEYCAYLLFFSFATSREFYKILPISTPFPFENFTCLVNRNSISVINFICDTFRKVTCNTSIRSYCSMNINFLSSFDLIFPLGKSVEVLDISSFCISIIMEVSGDMISRCSRMFQRKLDSEDSIPASISETELSEPASEIEEFFERNVENAGEYGSWLQNTNE